MATINYQSRLEYVSGQVSLPLNNIHRLFRIEANMPCLERERGKVTPHGDAYKGLMCDPAYKLDTPEGRKAWQAAAPAGDRIIPEDGAEYIWHVQHFLIEPEVEYLLNDLMPYRLEGYTQQPDMAERVSKEYKKQRDAMETLSLPRLRDKPKRTTKSAKLWSERNAALTEALEKHPKGIGYIDLYHELAKGITANISPETFRKWFYDNRCKYRLEVQGASSKVVER